MNEFREGQLHTYCGLVKAGKPLAVLTIKENEIEKCMDIICRIYDLKLSIVESAKPWKDLYIYQTELMGEVLKSLPEKPKSIFDHWVLGKAFGYSDQAIMNFLHSKL
jgi:hypothetical protein